MREPPPRFVEFDGIIQSKKRPSTTDQPFSFISYNSSLVLKQALETNCDSMGFQFAVAFHPAYELSDGTTRKYHFHVLIVPTVRIDLKQFADLFIEDIDGQLATKFSTMSPCRSFGDWYYYCKHDSKYCEVKRLKKPYYDLDDSYFFGSHDLMVELKAYELDDVLFSSATPVQKMVIMIQKGYDCYLAMDELKIPYSQMRTFAHSYRELQAIYHEQIKESIRFDRGHKLIHWYDLYSFLQSLVASASINGEIAGNRLIIDRYQPFERDIPVVPIDIDLLNKL